ncbi:MAG TPA: helix-turn-helix transcriptional regulator [Methylomusa anaerophila]|uniref:PBP superfamily domain protein n=1 Tax=Methylomusa anaerophila TaxID=1930071 RepID=A0A348AK70_9FIRM|nr:helix-turn-helix transcriptional regulator [Methylomusa anaerophila]BBB91468.1 PBP superfamily domain protein [Methylomusa anaerophila]HML89942.1 helix-turn-helix transcriptional regulator [Methylomusa anaerophila]
MAEDVSYTPEEVAKILKISRFTVYELIKRGELTGYRVGRKVRVEASDLEIYKSKTKGNQPAVTATDRRAEALFCTSEGLIVCGQDAILDALTRHMEKKMPNLHFLRNYCGSLDGLGALYRGTANAVTAHLWDSDSGEYNIPYVRRMLPGHKTVIINLVYRMSGFYVAKGNPKNIRDWLDLTKSGVRFVNRERGSGTRVLIDEKLRVLGIDSRQIDSYDREETSHLAVASCVARSEADVGVGTEKIALQVKDIDFIPMQKERYDLVIRKEDMDKPQFRSLLDVLRSTTFRNEIAGMSGYDISRTGEIIAEV